VFPLDDRGFTNTYNAQTNALHMYGYYGRIRMDGREIPLSPGDVTISRSRGHTCYDLPQPGQHHCIHFRFPQRTTAPHATIPIHFSLGIWRDVAAQRIMAIAQHLMHQPQSSSANAAASAGMLELLLWLSQRYEQMGTHTTGQRADRAVERAAATLEEDLARPLDVPELAEQVGLSQNYLSKLFRRRYGMTIPRYLLTRRISHARDLLLSTDLPVGRIATRVGLPDPQHFNKQFRRVTGISPTQMRIG